MGHAFCWSRGGAPSDWAGSHLARAEALLTGSQTACGGTGVSGVSPHPLSLWWWALCLLAPELASWVWGISGACLRHLVSHYEMIQNREFGAKELKWEGEF